MNLELKNGKLILDTGIDKTIIGSVRDEKSKIDNLAGWYVDTKKLIREEGYYYVLGEIERMVEEIADNDQKWLYYFLHKDKEVFDESDLNKEIRDKGLKISLIAQKYGLKLVSNRTKCPFHNGKNKTSLLFDDDKNRFKCWSCGESGNLVYFIKLMKGLK